VGAGRANLPVFASRNTLPAAVWCIRFGQPTVEAVMFRSCDQAQGYLLPPSLRDFVVENHPAHLINDLVDLLDLNVLEARYGNLGQPAYHPRLMVKILLYGFTVGIFSSRKLQRACQENLAFKYLAGMETPAFKTFIEFRQRHRDDMRAVFLQTAKLARQLGLARLGAVALDGSKVDANTSKHKAMSYGRMQEEEKRLKAEINALLEKAKALDEQEDQEYGPDDDGYQVSEELARREQRLKKIKEAKEALEKRERETHPGEPIDPKKQISFADQDARCFTKQGDGTRYVYNAQAAVDMDSQIIVANHIEDSVSDAHAAEAVLESMEQDWGELPGKLVTDAGYGNKDTLDSCRDRGVTPICATAREGKEGQAPRKLDRFSYDADQDRFVCPHGHLFIFMHEHPTDGTRTYKTTAPARCSCGHYETADGREVIRVGQGHLARRALKRIMDEPGHRELYRRRKCTAEPPFGQIKAGMGFRRFLYRGRQNVSSEWNLVCAALNLRKIAALHHVTQGVAIPKRASMCPFLLRGWLTLLQHPARPAAPRVTPLANAA
jgi:transposase